MNTLTFMVSGNRLKLVSGYTPISGEKGYSTLKFIFDKEWEDVESIYVSQFFDADNAPEPVHTTIKDGVAVCDIHEELRNQSGKLHIGVVGTVSDGSGVVIDTNIAHVAVGEGVRLNGTESTKLIQDLIEYLAMIESNLLTKGNQVGTENIKDGAVTGEKIAPGAVDTDQIADGAVTGDKIASGAVTAYKIGQYAVKDTAIHPSAVTTDKIKDEAVTAGKIAEGAVGTDQIADGAVTGDKIEDMTIGDEKLAETYWMKTDVYSVESYAYLDNTIEQCVGTICKLKFDPKFPRYGLLGDGEYIGIPVGTNVIEGLLLISLNDGKRYKYTSGGDLAELEPVYTGEGGSGGITTVMDNSIVYIPDGAISTEENLWNYPFEEGKLHHFFVEQRVAITKKISYGYYIGYYFIHRDGPFLELFNLTNLASYSIDITNKQVWTLYAGNPASMSYVDSRFETIEHPVVDLGVINTYEQLRSLDLKANDSCVFTTGAIIADQIGYGPFLGTYKVYDNNSDGVIDNGNIDRRLLKCIDLTQDIRWEIDIDTEICTKVEDNSVKDYVDEKLGDIDTALDSIIELQNSYIGGVSE